MVQQILDDMRTYFEAKSTMTPEEQALLQRLNDDFFPITSVSREDLKAYGFDTRSVTDAQMCRLAQKWQMITVNSFSGRAWKLSPKGWSFRVTLNVRFAPADMFASMSKKKRSVVKVAGRSGMNICMFWSSFLTTRPSSKKNISAILRSAAGTTAHAMFRNTITSPISRKNRSRTDISSRSVGRNRSRIFSPTSPTTLSIA